MARRSSGAARASGSPAQPGFPFDPALERRAAVLFAEGDRPEVLDRPRVAIVGTRAATPPGIADARAIGRYLAEQGITVVSGLALGIDGAAHAGALEVGGGVIGVVATGLDIVYPAPPRRCCSPRCAGTASCSASTASVCRRPGRGSRSATASSPALCDATVVVEATANGGAAHHGRPGPPTYDREVLAVPGSRRNPAAAGCNELIADGAHPLLDPSDVMSVLGRHSPASGCAAAAAGPGRVGWGEPRLPVSPAARRLHAGMAGEPATLDELVAPVRAARRARSPA